MWTLDAKWLTKTARHMQFATPNAPMLHARVTYRQNFPGINLENPSNRLLQDIATINDVYRAGKGIKIFGSRKVSIITIGMLTRPRT